MYVGIQIQPPDSLSTGIVEITKYLRAKYHFTQKRVKRRGSRVCRKFRSEIDWKDYLIDNFVLARPVISNHATSHPIKVAHSASLDQTHHARGALESSNHTSSSWWAESGLCGRKPMVELGLLARDGPCQITIQGRKTPAAVRAC
jgi:hypothetical protein